MTGGGRCFPAWPGGGTTPFGTSWLNNWTGGFVSDSLRLVEAYKSGQWTVLADPTRRVIFERLAAKPQAVGELAQGLPVSRPAVSQHLKVLKEAGLVVDRPVGTRRVYRPDPAGLAALRSDLERFWTQALATYKQVVEQPTEDKEE